MCLLKHSTKETHKVHNRSGTTIPSNQSDVFVDLGIFSNKKANVNRKS